MARGRIGAKRASLAALALATSIAAPFAVAQECEVKIGAVGPMSGGAAAWGQAAKAGGDFVAALYNEDGGLPIGGRKCRVRVIPFDSQYTAAGGAAASNFLASQNVRALIGPVTAPELTGFRPVGKRNGQLTFHTAYAENALTNEYPLEFHAIQVPAAWGALLVRTAVEQFKFKSVVIVGANDQGGTDASRQLAKQYTDAGVKTSEEYYQRGTVNFAPIVARLMNAKPDAIETATMPPADASALVKGLMEAGYEGVFGALGGNGSTPSINGAGGVEKFKAFYWLEVSPVDHPGVVKMKADFQRLMKATAPVNPLFPAYATATEVLLKAISTAGTDQDSEKIADALRKSMPETRYMGKAGWRGKGMYGLNQELSFPIGLGMIIDGKRLPVRTVPIPAE